MPLLPVAATAGIAERRGPLGYELEVSKQFVCIKLYFNRTGPAQVM